MSANSAEINRLRQKIDSIDDQIKALFEQRLVLASDIAHCKAQNDLPIFDGVREQEILTRLTADLDADTAEQITVLFTTILELSRSHQAKI